MPSFLWLWKYDPILQSFKANTPPNIILLALNPLNVESLELQLG